MEKPIITWDDLTEEKKDLVVCHHHLSNKDFFNYISSFVQQKLIEKRRLILNPVEDWAIEGQKGCSGSFWSSKLRLKEIVDKLTSPPEPKERLVYVSWDKEWSSSTMVNFGAGICDWGFNVPESLAKEIGFFVSDWNAARESGKLDDFEVNVE